MLIEIQAGIGLSKIVYRKTSNISFYIKLIAYVMDAREVALLKIYFYKTRCIVKNKHRHGKCFYKDRQFHSISKKRHDILSKERA